MNIQSFYDIKNANISCVFNRVEMKFCRVVVAPMPFCSQVVPWCCANHCVNRGHPREGYRPTFESGPKFQIGGSITRALCVRFKLSLAHLRPYDTPLHSKNFTPLRYATCILWQFDRRLGFLKDSTVLCIGGYLKTKPMLIYAKFVFHTLKHSISSTDRLNFAAFHLKSCFNKHL
jgi:hypothetical protein